MKVLPSGNSKYYYHIDANNIYNANEFNENLSVINYDSLRKIYNDSYYHIKLNFSCPYSYQKNNIIIIEILPDMKIYQKGDFYYVKNAIVKKVIPMSYFYQIEKYIFEPNFYYSSLKFKNLPIQTLNECKKLLSYDGLLLKDVHNQTEYLCEIAVKNDGLALQYVNEKNKTQKICNIAIRQNKNAKNFL
jgi:hypothetical protein